MTCYRHDQILFCIRCGSTYDMKTGTKTHNLDLLGKLKSRKYQQNVPSRPNR